MSSLQRSRCLIIIKGGPGSPFSSCPLLLACACFPQGSLSWGNLNFEVVLFYPSLSDACPVAAPQQGTPPEARAAVLVTDQTAPCSQGIAASLLSVCPS